MNMFKFSFSLNLIVKCFNICLKELKHKTDKLFIPVTIGN